MDNEQLTIKNEVAEPKIFVKIDGTVTRISAETFFKVSKGMFEVMREVDQAMNDGEASVRLEISQLETGSAAIGFAAVPLQYESDKAVAFHNTFVTGIRTIQERLGERPYAFTNKALKKLRGMIASLPPTENILTVGLRAEPVRLNMEAVAQIDQWLEVRYEAMGSIEGRLEDAKGRDIKGRDKNQCVVYDRSGRKIECHFAESDKELIKAGLFGRVAIRGRISYRADGSPVSIKPLHIKPLRGAGEMRDPEELMGTWKLSMNSEEYVESLHGE